MPGPRATVEEVYRALDLEMTSAHAAILDEEEERAREHKSSHRYALEEFGIDPGELETRLAPLFDRFAWPHAAE